jgi:stage IV sporulation protein FB
MRDPITWSFPIGRLFGITLRVHVMLPLVMLALVLKVTTAKDSTVTLGEASLLMLLFFGSVLLHELGHCFAARAVDGDASDMLLWPLGGLAYCDLPHTPKAHLVCAVGGPAATALIALLAGGALAFSTLVPPINPFDSPYQPRLWNWRDGAYRAAVVPHATAETEAPAPPAIDKPDGRAEITAARQPHPPALALWQVIAAQIFWLNWVGLLLNLLPGFPLDGGRIVQAILWWQSGDYRSSMSAASYAGFIVMLVIAVYSVVSESVLGIALAWFIYVNCKQQLILLESGGEESPFGYDFSQGYTSLEGAAPRAPPRRSRSNFFPRWLQRRAKLRAQRELEQRDAEDRRMDELLDKVQTHGFAALNDEERRFLVRVSARYRGGKA